MLEDGRSSDLMLTGSHPSMSILEKPSTPSLPEHTICSLKLDSAAVGRVAVLRAGLLVACSAVF